MVEAHTSLKPDPGPVVRDPADVLRVEHVSRQFGGRTALFDLSLSFQANRVTAIVGASGCGKSTLLRLCNGLLRPDSGRVTVFGTPVDYATLPQLRSRIGYAVQGSALFPHLTAWDNITLAARMQRWSAAQVDGRVTELRELMQLDSSVLKQYPHQLSGGQQQRVALSRAMMLRPEILLLDEPFAAIDPITRFDIHRQFLELKDAEPATVVLVTHDMREAMLLADDLAVMHEGQLRSNTTRSALRAQAPDLEPEALLQSLLEDSRR